MKEIKKGILFHESFFFFKKKNIEYKIIQVIKKILFIVFSNFILFLFIWVAFEAHTNMAVKIKIIPQIIEFAEKRFFFLLSSAIFGVYSFLVRLLFYIFFLPIEIMVDGGEIFSHEKAILMQGNRPSLGESSGDLPEEDPSDSRGRGKRPRNLWNSDNFSSASPSSRPRAPSPETRVATSGIDTLVDGNEMPTKYDFLTDFRNSASAKLSRIREWFPKDSNSNSNLSEEQTDQFMLLLG